MDNPMEALWRVQLSLCESWIKMWRNTFVMYDTLIEQQAKLLNHPVHFRLQDIIPDGAALTDKYGHRCHDVDVERV